MNKTSTLISRLLAAVALIVAVVVVIAVVNSNTGSGDDGDKGKNTPAKNKQGGKKKSKKAKYEVQSGDTLTGIAQKTGVPVERIEKLNPELDPQALQAGQELKLR